jgi:hypothetical protein
MSPRPVLASLLLAAACTPLAAQTAPAAAPAVANPTAPSAATAPVDVLPRSAAEPVAERVVIEGSGARIEEQHLRGEVRSIHVSPKGAPAYEVIPANGGRDLTNSHGNSRGNAGQRVWSVLRF